MNDFQTAPSSAPTVFAYVGSYTDRNHHWHGTGITVFRVEPGSEVWTQVQQLWQDCVDPSFLALDTQERFLYCVHESLGKVSAFSINKQTGHLTWLNTQATNGADPASLSLDPTNRFLVVGNYSSGSVALLPIGPDGKLEPLSQLINLEGKPGPDKVEQAGSHPHHIQFDPAGQYLMIPDKGFDKVFCYKFDVTSQKLIPNNPASVQLRAGSGPRHIAFHPSPSQPYAYLISELASTLTVLKYDAARGSLSPLQVISTLPPTFRGHNTGAEINIAPSGKFVYGSNRGDDSIVGYQIDPHTGKLSLIEWVSTQGKNPRFCTLDFWGRFLYAANQDGDSIVAFQVDQETGKLTPTNQVIAVKNPVCIIFASQA